MSKETKLFSLLEEWHASPLVGKCLSPLYMHFKFSYIFQNAGLAMFEAVPIKKCIWNISIKLMKRL